MRPKCKNVRDPIISRKSLAVADPQAGTSYMIRPTLRRERSFLSALGGFLNPEIYFKVRPLASELHQIIRVQISG